MSDEKKYHCFNCENSFGDIPVFGCPYCQSDNYYAIDDELNATEEECTLGVGACM